MSDSSEQPLLVLEGIAGWVRGERFLINEGETTVGRSRSCDISLRRIAGYLEQPSEERDKDHDFNTVSRKHIVITSEGYQVRIQDLSTNGTFCDEAPVDAPIELNIEQQSVVVRLGTRETFRLTRSNLITNNESTTSASVASGQPAVDDDEESPVKDSSVDSDDEGQATQGPELDVIPDDDTEKP